MGAGEDTKSITSALPTPAFSCIPWQHPHGTEHPPPRQWARLAVGDREQWVCGCVATTGQGRRAPGLPAAGPALLVRAAGTVLQQRIRFGAGEPGEML